MKAEVRALLNAAKKQRLENPHLCYDNPNVKELAAAAESALEHWVGCLLEQERVLGEKSIPQRTRIKRLLKALTFIKEVRGDWKPENPR